LISKENSKNAQSRAKSRQSKHRLFVVETIQIRPRFRVGDPSFFQFNACPAAVLGDELDAVKASSYYPRVDALH